MIAELNLLLEAELSYAHFNAQRTAGDARANALSLTNIGTVPYITDAGRPESEYYNRAVVRPITASLADAMQDIPQNVKAIELLIPEQTKQNFACLLAAGFEPTNSLCYLAAPPYTAECSDMPVQELRTDQQDFFFDLLELSGASFPNEKRIATKDFYCTDAFRCFVAFDSDDQPAGWATMYINNGTAFLANAFTLTKYRGKGAHSALLSARLNLASQLQLTYAFTDVEAASRSHRNCERYGFRLLTVNSIWART